MNFLVPFSLPLPPATETGCNWLELPLVVREQFFRHLVGYVFLFRLTYFFVLPWLLDIDFFIDFSDFYFFAVEICVRNVISALGQLRDLAHSKNDFWTHFQRSIGVLTLN